MTFEQWWDRLTPKEHMVLGINNARFVWQAAVEAERNRLASQCERLPFGNTAHSFAAWIREGGAHD